MIINPFRPNSPVHSAMFVGRINELERIENRLLQTRAGNPSHFLITGERGIGKTSLLIYVKAVASGAISLDNDESLRFLVLDIDIDARTTQLTLIRKIELAIRKSLDKSEPARAFLATCWDFMKRVEIAGTKIESEPEDLDLLVDEFSYSLGDIADRLTADDKTFGSRFDGVLLFVDEADKASPELDLGTILKAVTERLARRGTHNMLIGLAGLPGLRDVLMESHPSSLRLFEDLELGRLSDEEVERAIGLAAESEGSPAISDDAKDQLIRLSEGYPHFVQQFGFSAVERVSGDTLTADAVVEGAYSAGGALEVIGDRFYRDDFYNRIQKESYRQVLRIMADRRDEWVTKRYIRDRFTGKQTTLNNAINALKSRNIIIPKVGVRGSYRLQHKAFAHWINLQRQPPRET